MLQADGSSAALEEQDKPGDVTQANQQERLPLPERASCIFLGSARMTTSDAKTWADIRLEYGEPDHSDEPAD